VRRPGDLDPSFHTDGKVTTGFANSTDAGLSVALQEDGKIVVAGYASNGSDSDIAVARYKTNGSLDGEFGTNGKAMVAFGDSDQAIGLALQDDGKIVAAGSARNGSNYDFALARYFGGHDATPPNMKAPVQALLANFTLGASTTSASVPTRISWSATDSEGKVTRYQLQRSVDAGAYTNVSLPSALTTRITPSLTPASNYRYRVRATDDNGNTSFFKYGPRFTVDAHQETSRAIAYSGTWKQQNISSAYGAAVKYATTKGATARLTFTGRSVAWIAPKSNARGKAEVYLDGVKVATVDLYSSKVMARKVVYAKNRLNPSATHTLMAKVLGTKRAASSGVRVDVDAFVVLR
jgi:uncharacterized delta-60 repeat protein